MNKCFHSFCLLRKALTFFCFIMFLSLHNYRCLTPQFYAALYSVFIKDKVFMLVCSNLWLLPSQFVRHFPADVTQKETITFLIQTTNKLLNKPVSWESAVMCSINEIWLKTIKFKCTLFQFYLYSTNHNSHLRGFIL